MRGSLLNQVTALIHKTTAENSVTKKKETHFCLPVWKANRDTRSLLSNKKVVKCSQMIGEARVPGPSGVSTNKMRVFLNCETFCLKKVMDTKSFHVFKKIYNCHPIPCNSCLYTQYELVVFTNIGMKSVNFVLQERLDISWTVLETPSIWNMW